MRRCFILLLGLVVVFATMVTHALEAPPNVRWKRELTLPAQTNTTAHINDCKVLSNGDLAILGEFSGIGPILGATYDSVSQPTNGLFVAVQSSSGDLRWLHRFSGDGAPKLGIDSADNLHLIAFTKDTVSLLGTNLSAETDTVMLYQLSLKTNGTLNDLKRLGKMTGIAPHNYNHYLHTIYQPLNDGYLVSLEFQETIHIDGNTYESEDDILGVLWLKLDPQGKVLWAHCFSASTTAFLSPHSLMKSPSGGYLGHLSLHSAGKFNRQPYGTTHQLTNNVVIWLSAEGEVTRTAHIPISSEAMIHRAAFASNGDLILAIAGCDSVTIRSSEHPPLEMTLPPPSLHYRANLTIARLTGDLSTLHWQKDSGISAVYCTSLGFDQSGSIYATVQAYGPFEFDEVLFKESVHHGIAMSSIALLKLAPDGELQWGRFDKTDFPPASAVARDGTSYLASPDGNRITSYAPDIGTSPPEFHILPLTNHLASAGSTFYFSPQMTSSGDHVYYWYKDGILITNSTSSPLVISNLSSADLGSYTVTASNQFGSVSAGPFTFTLGPSSLLSRVETLGLINASLQVRPDAKFSPDGSKHIVAGASYFYFFYGTNYYAPELGPMTFSVTGNSTGKSNLLIAPPSVTGYSPRAAIASDGSSFIVNTGTNDGMASGWIIGYDPLGNQQWAYSYRNNSPADIVVHKDEAIYIATSCDAGSTFGSTTLTDRGLYLLKFSMGGEFLSASRLLGCTNSVDIFNLRLASDGSGYLHGVTDGALTQPDGTVIPASGDMFLVHFDASGQFVWHKSIPLESFTPSMACDIKGVVMGMNLITGQSFLGLPPLEGTSGVSLVRWNRDGTLAWHRSIRSNADYVGCFSLALDPGGNVIAGFAADGAINLGSLTSPAYPLHPDFSLQGSMVRFSPQGTALDVMVIPTDFGAITYCMDIAPKGRLLFSGLAGSLYSIRPTTIQMGPFLQQHEGYGDIFYGITAPLGPSLVTESTGSQLKLNWSEYLTGFSLESSASPTGPWTAVITSTNSITLEAGTSGNQFFRLKGTAEEIPPP